MNCPPASHGVLVFAQERRTALSPSLSVTQPNAQTASPVSCPPLALSRLKPHPTPAGSRPDAAPASHSRALFQIMHVMQEPPTGIVSPHFGTQPHNACQAECASGTCAQSSRGPRGQQLPVVAFRKCTQGLQAELPVRCYLTRPGRPPFQPPLPLSTPTHRPTPTGGPSDSRTQ